MVTALSIAYPAKVRLTTSRRVIPQCGISREVSRKGHISFWMEIVIVRGIPSLFFTSPVIVLRSPVLVLNWIRSFTPGVIFSYSVLWSVVESARFIAHPDTDSMMISRAIIDYA